MEQLGKYQLVRKLATGGMAEVFLARSAGPLGFEKILVLKRILPHLAQDERFLAMFRSEATLAARLDHPNVVQIFDFGESDGEFYLAMEYIDGPTLRQVLRRAAAERMALPLPFCAKVASLVCDGLAYAHDFCDPQTGQWLGIIHRDISPENILISRSGSVKVVDFGIAKAAAVSKTKSHSLRGKYGYLAPEQLRRKAPLDRRVDIYSLGVVLYELVTGTRPFEAASEMDVMQAILSERFTPASRRRPDVPADLDRILERALGRRDERYPTCQAFQVDLEAFLQRHGEAMTSQHLTKVIADLGLVSWGQSGPHPILSLESLRLDSPAEPNASTVAGAPGDGALPSDAPAPEGTSAPPAQTTGATLSDPHLNGLDLASARTDPELGARDFGFQVVTGVVVVAALVLVSLTYLVARREAPSPQPPPAGATTVNPAPPPTPPAPAPPAPASSRLASLRVESVPPGDVWIDDVLLGRSPVSIVNHPPGPARIRVSDAALGFRKEERIELAPGQNGTKRIVVRRLPVELHVKPWAQATLDGRSIGRIAQERLDLFEGPHTLRLVNPVLRREQTLELVVRPGRDNVFWVDLYR